MGLWGFDCRTMGFDCGAIGFDCMTMEATHMGPYEPYHIRDITKIYGSEGALILPVMYFFQLNVFFHFESWIFSFGDSS